MYTWEILIEYQFTDVRNATLSHGKRKRTLLILCWFYLAVKCIDWI